MQMKDSSNRNKSHFIGFLMSWRTVKTCQIVSKYLLEADISQLYCTKWDTGGHFVFMQIRQNAQKWQGVIKRILITYISSDPNQPKNIVYTHFPGSASWLPDYMGSLCYACMEQTRKFKIFPSIVTVLLQHSNQIFFAT